jgi:hypothetical protein
MKHSLLLVTALAAGVSALSLSSYHIGNSIIDQFDGIPTIASSKGDALTFKRKSIPGAGISYNYQNCGIPIELSGGTWDIIMPLAFCNGSELGIDADVKYFGLYYDAGLANNAACRLVIFVQWPDMGDWETKWHRTLDMSKPGYAQPYGSAAYHEMMLTKLRAKYPGKQVHLVPVGHCMDEFHHQASQGKLSGYSGADDLYGDGIHLNSKGKYIQNLAGYAVFFKKDPHGAGLTYAQWSGNESVTQSFATIAADIVWTVVQRMSTSTGVTPSGVKSFALSVRPAPVMPQQRDLYSLDGTRLIRHNMSTACFPKLLPSMMVIDTKSKAQAIRILK